MSKKIIINWKLGGIATYSRVIELDKGRKISDIDSVSMRYQELTIDYGEGESQLCDLTDSVSINDSDHLIDADDTKTPDNLYLFDGAKSNVALHIKGTDGVPAH